MQLPDIQIETERLVLRLPKAQDFEAYAGLMGDEDAARYLGGLMPRAAAWRRFLQMPGAWAIQGYAMFSVVEKSSGDWIGQMGAWRPDGWPGTEVGWAFVRSSWGRGYATEAGVASIDWAFTHLDIDEVIHSIHPDNAASNLLAQRLGSVNRGPGELPEPFAGVPNQIWGQTRAQWLALRAQRDGSAK